MARYDLSEAEWRLIKPLLPNKPRGVARVDDQRVINGIFYVLRTGSPWRDLPERFGPYTTVYNRYNRWAKAGVWLKIFETLAAKSPNEGSCSSRRRNNCALDSSSTFEPVRQSRPSTALPSSTSAASRRGPIPAIPIR